MPDITTETALRLVAEQFPQWAHLKIKPVARSGHDNRTFHLGEEMTIRLPSGKAYVPQIEKEAKWLPFLADHLSLPISRPIARGNATDYYPFPWSINRYIEGEPLGWPPLAPIKQGSPGNSRPFCMSCRPFQLREPPKLENITFSEEPTLRFTAVRSSPH